MSRLFSQYPKTAPLAQPIAQALKLYTPSNKPPLVAPVFIDWKLYSNGGSIPEIGIEFDVGSAIQGQSTLDKITSVYIDNTNSNVPIYVQFPDTLHVIPCGPGQSSTALAITGGTKFTVYGIGFTGGVQPITLLAVANQMLPSSVQPDEPFVVPQYLASTINPYVPNNAAFRTLAIGDQISTQFINITALAPITVSPYCIMGASPIDAIWTWPTGFDHVGCYAYITALQLSLNAGVFHRNTGAISIAPAFFQVYSELGDINIGGNYVHEVPTTGIQESVNVTIFSWSGLQIKTRCDSGNLLKFGLNGNLTPFINNVAGNTYLDIAMLQLTMVFTVRDESNSPI